MLLSAISLLAVNSWLDDNLVAVLGFGFVSYFIGRLALRFARADIDSLAGGLAFAILAGPFFAHMIWAVIWKQPIPLETSTYFGQAVLASLPSSFCSAVGAIIAAKLIG